MGARPKKYPPEAEQMLIRDWGTCTIEEMARRVHVRYGIQVAPKTLAQKVSRLRKETGLAIDPRSGAGKGIPLADAAQMLGVPWTTLIRSVHEGRLPTLRMGHYHYITMATYKKLEQRYPKPPWPHVDSWTACRILKVDQRTMYIYRKKYNLRSIKWGNKWLYNAQDIDQLKWDLGKVKLYGQGRTLSGRYSTWKLNSSSSNGSPTKTSGPAS